MLVNRCGWVTNDALYLDYHDHEWGVPTFDDKRLFEFLVLEGAQAGLSWYTILKKRENYRKAFAEFDPAKVAQFDDMKVAELLANEGIVRNRLKVLSAISNARSFLAVQDDYESFAQYLWNFVDGKPILHHFATLADVPSSTDLSDRVSKDLKHRGFRFVGTTIVYAYLQAVGVVMDHVQSCFLYKQIIDTIE